MDTAAMSAMHTYHEAVERLEELAHVAKADHKPLTARSRARGALIALAAERAEMLDPDPLVRRDCQCVDCLLYREYAPKEASPLS